MITAAGVVVVLVAIGANFLLWQQEMSEEPLTEQASAPQAAAKAAAEAAARAADRARQAAAKAAAAKQAADEAIAKAEAPDATADIKDAAAKARAAATAAEEESRQADAAAAAAKTVADAASQAAQLTGQPAKPGATATPSLPTGPVSPSFDVVRINPKGDTVMAGRATPGSKVRILDHGKVIGEVTADKRGEWVFVPETPLPAGTSELTLESESGGTKMASNSAVMLVVPEKGKDIAGQPTSQPQQPLALMVPSGPQKITIPDNPIPSVVLQKPTTGESASSLSVDAIDYDDAGRLSISGQADKGALVQLYLDNKFLGRSTTGDDGRWSITPESRIEPGLYTLRIDQVDTAGKVLARVTLPFSRAEPLSPGAGRYVIVQPGNSLWRIARRTYGIGFQYTVIFDANAEQIADPNPIYPGQIFELPATK